MWKLFKRGIKPWEYQMSYTKEGNPIVYKDDIDLLLFVDNLNERGIEHERKKEEALAKVRKRQGQS
jgi:hypothetical protein